MSEHPALLPSPQGSAPLVDSPGDALPPGTRLAEIEIRQVLGAGGFGIVYLAWDHALEREVAVKEYMPVMLAARGAATRRLTIRSSSQQDTFVAGLRSFVNEARLLARFDHPALVKVYRFWEDNGTAYMAMPMVHGRTLREVRQAMTAGSPGEAWCRALIEPMLGALDCLHKEGVYHRDIAPDNILLQDDGHPVLLDFGAARRVIGDRAQAITAVLKPNYAPIEQYADSTALRQGPWTDLYALAATLYYLLTGSAPLSAAARVVQDDLPPLARLNPSGCSQTFLQAVDWAMSVRPQERPQGVAAWREVLEGRMPVPSLLRFDITTPGVTAREVAAASPAPALASMAAPSTPTDFDPTRPAASFHGATLQAQAADRPAANAARSVAATHRGQKSSRWPIGLAAALMLALIAAFTAVLPRRSDEPTTAQAASAPMAAASATAPVAPAASAAGELRETIIETSHPPKIPAPRAPMRDPRAHDREREGRSRDRDSAAAPDPSLQLAVLTPEERCGDHMFLTRLICIQHECDSDVRLHSSPACVGLQKADEQRRDRIGQ